MGDVIHVKFGAEKNWDDTHKIIASELRATIESFLPAKVDRAELIAGKTVEHMRSLEKHLSFTLSHQIEIPPGDPGEAARRAVEDARKQFVAGVELALADIRDAAYKAIALAASSAVTLLVYEHRT